MPDNHAAWLPAARAQLAVGDAPYKPPGPDEIVVRASAIAMNLVDWMKQDVGDMAFKWIRYPIVLGNDVAGEVVEVGSNVELAGQFRPGMRVVGQALGEDPLSAKPAEGAFQEYVVLKRSLVSEIPEWMDFESASVLPLALSTAASAMFCEKYLGLRYPSMDNYYGGEARDKAGDILVVWGASTAVGMNAVQLAVAAGYTVIATAGQHNFDLVRGLGASQVYSYRSPTCVHDIVQTIRRSTAGKSERKCVGAIAIGEASTKPCIEIVDECCDSRDRKYVAQVSLDGPAKVVPGLLGTVSFVAQMLWAQATSWVKKTLKGVAVHFVWGSDLYDGKVDRAVYGEFLPAALAARKYVPMPEPQAVGRGLDKVQEAFEVGRKGVSAKKIVVTL